MTTTIDTDSPQEVEPERARMVRDLCVTEASTLASRYNLAADELCDMLKRFLALNHLAHKAARKYSADPSQHPHSLTAHIQKTFLPIACSAEKPTDMGEANLAAFTNRFEAELAQAVELERERLHNMGLKFV